MITLSYYCTALSVSFGFEDRRQTRNVDKFPELLTVY